MPFQIGERVGDYEVIQVLGKGGMGEVYKVRHVISDRVEAMKVLLPNLEHDADLVDRFLREIKVQASLSHPNIAALYTAMKHGNNLLMLMEFVEGVSIDERIRRGPLPVAEGVEYIRQALVALAYAHAQGVVHRDIKPANLMVTGKGVVKLMDFGIARMKQDRKLTNTGQTVGSLYYMSPEQIRGEQLGNRSDIYSLGITLYEVVTGKRPFEGTSDYSIMAAHLQQNPVPPIQVDPKVPARLNEIILTAIAKDPNQRFQKAEAFANALAGVLGPAAPAPAPAPAVNAAAAAAPPKPVAAPAAPVVPTPVPYPAASSPAWGRWAIIGVAALLLVGLAASQIPKWRHAAPEPAAQTELVKQNPAEPDPTALPSPTGPQPAGNETAPPAPAPEPTVTPAAKPDTAQKNASPVKAAAPEPVIHVAPAKSVAATPAASAPSAPVAQPVVAQPAVSQPETPVVRPAPPAPDTHALEELRDRSMKLGIRIGAVVGKARSLEQQQAAQGVGLRSDVKSDINLVGLLMDDAERRMGSGNAAAAKASLDKAEHVVERLERILGL